MLASVIAAVISGVVALSAPGAASAAVSGTVAGTVFEDYNANGVMDPGSNDAASASATDIGVGNATVNVIDSVGATVGSGVSATNGTFSISVSAATAEVRVQITPAAGFNAGPHGPDSASTVQFVTLNTPAATAVKVALTRLGDYAPNGPRLVTAIQRAAVDFNFPGAALKLVDQTTTSSIASSAYADRGTTPPTAEAYFSQTGAIWGLAQLDSSYAFSAAFFRRHSAVGPTVQVDPNELGAIYLTNLSAAPNATPWVTIPNAGSNPRADESTMTAQDWFNDVDGYTQVGKIGLGGLAMAPDRKALYVVNLRSKSLWRVPLTATAAAPIAGVPVESALPLSLPGAATGCPSVNDVRPFGVAAQNGALWITLTCTGPAIANLRGYVYRYDLATATFGATPALETALGGYPRGNLAGPGLPAAWQPWQLDSDTTFPAGSFPLRPEPLLSDVAFDANGDMTVGIKDRFSDQAGYGAGNRTPGSITQHFAFAAGDSLRACTNPAAVWVLESNGACGTRIGSGVGNGQGVGGGEFYDDDYKAFHDQVTLGGLLQLPGYGEILDTAFDPLPPDRVTTLGYRFFTNTNGAIGSAHELVGPSLVDGSSFGKAGGLGDMAALVAAAPLEIGNRVWFDADFDGIQDSGEAPIAGVTVNLYAANGTTLLATAVTDGAGRYYFSNAPGTSTPSARFGLAALTPETDFVVRLDNPANAAAGGPLNGYSLTQTTAGADRTIESNGRRGPGGFSEAPVRTGLASVNDHTIDFGFVVSTYAVGDYVWFDDDRDGVQDPGEPPVAGVRVTLIDAATGQPARHPDGTPVVPVTTDANGHYVFDFLLAGSYQVQFSTFPAGYQLTIQGSGGAADSNPAVATGLTPPFAIGPLSVADMRPVVGSDGTSVAVAINPTIDAGLVRDPVPGLGGSEKPVSSSSATTVDLTITKRADKATVDGNETITWTVKVANNGPGTAPGVVVLDETSLPVTFTRAQSTVGTCTTMPVRCQLGTMAPGASATITLMGRAHVAGTLRNQATVALAPGSPAVETVLTNNVATATTRVRAALRLTKTANRKTVRAGGRLTYTIRVSNPTGVAVRDARVCDRLPAGLAYVRSRPKAKLSNGRYCWKLGTVAAKTSRSLKITVLALRGIHGARTNVATLTASGVARATGNARVEVLGTAARGGGITG